MDWEQGITLAVLIMISFMLVGGFYVKNIPVWLTWCKFLSPITNAFTMLMLLEFDSDERFL